MHKKCGEAFILKKRILSLCMLLVFSFSAVLPTGTPVYAADTAADALPQWESVGDALPAASGNVSLAADKKGNIYAAYRTVQQGKTAAYDGAVSCWDGTAWKQLALVHADDTSVSDITMAICNGKLYVAWVDSDQTLFGGWLDNNAITTLWSQKLTNPAAPQLTVSGTTLYLTYTTGAKAEEPDTISLLNGITGKALAPDITGTKVAAGQLAVLKGQMYMLYAQAADATNTETVIATYSTKTGWKTAYTLQLQNAQVYTLASFGSGLYAAAGTTQTTTADKTVYITYDGTTWTENTVDSLAGVSALQLQFNAGTPYLLYREAAAGGRMAVMTQTENAAWAQYAADVATQTGGMAAQLLANDKIYAVYSAVTKTQTSLVMNSRALPVAAGGDTSSSTSSSDASSSSTSSSDTGSSSTNSSSDTSGSSTTGDGTTGTQPPAEPEVIYDVTITPPEGYTDTTLYIDGVEYTTTAKNGVLSTKLTGSAGKTVIMYKYNENGIPVGMYVWELSYAEGVCTATAVPELEDLLTYLGFSIRVDGSVGIRFKTGISVDTRAALQSGLAGYTLNEYGTLVMRQDARDEHPFIKGDSYVSSGRSYWYDNGLHDIIFETRGGKYRFTSVLVDLPTDRYPVEYAFRGYIILQKGEEAVTLYGPPVARSISYVAGQIIVSNEFTSGGVAHNSVMNILKAVKPNGWVGDYYFTEGELAVGLRDITDGTATNTYVFDKNGKLQKGETTADGKVYYADAATGVVQKNFIRDRGTGSFTYYDATGAATEGWHTVDGKQYYQQLTGSVFSLATGKQTLEGKIYFFNSDGSLNTSDGWVDDYYVQNGQAVTGRQTIDEKQYIFSADGRVYKGIFVYENKNYCADASTGVLFTDYFYVHGSSTGYYNADGVAELGWVTRGTDKYYQQLVNTLPTLLTGKQTIEGKIYLFENDGRLSAVQNGWVGDYYLKDGALLTGLQDITANDEMHTYIFDKDGKLQKGDITYLSKAYYADSTTGIIQKSFLRDRGTLGKTYYDDKGVSAEGWVTVAEGKYYQLKTTNGVFRLASGFQKIGEFTYYFEPQTCILLQPKADGKVTIEGKDYYVYTDGRIAVEPTISAVSTSYNSANQTYTITVTADFGPVGTHTAGSYSFDGGITWQAGNSAGIAAVSGGVLAAGKIQVRNAMGQVASYGSAISIAKKNLLGIDVSAHQAVVDFNKVKASGVDFVIVRALTWNKAVNYYVIDSYFEQNVRNAKAAGLKVGVYLYSYAFNPTEMAEEVNFFLNSAELKSLKNSGIKFDYPVYIDYEDPLVIKNGGTKANRTETVKTGMVLLEKAGYYPGFYTYDSFARNYIDAEGLINQGYDFWLANFSGSHTFGSLPGIWQYISTGSVNGVSGNVDMNTAYKDYAAIINPDGGSAVTPVEGTLTVYDLNTSKNVTASVADILAQIVNNEVGGGLGLSGGDAKILYRAQAVAAHSWIMYQYQQGITAPSVGLKASPSADIVSAVADVKNNVVLYNGAAACTVYGSGSFSTTNSSANMGWGALPYLTNVASSYESWAGSAWQGRNKTITADTMKTNIEKMLGAGATNGIPYSQWITNPVYDSYGYCTSITVCGKTISGGTFYENCWGLYSPRFSITATDATNGSWTFVTYGNGHCVGMSQFGAAGMIAHGGYTWQQILQHYYPGTTIS